MNVERYDDEVKTLFEAAQQQAVMNYHQELSTKHFIVALCGQPDGFFKFLLHNVNADEKAFTAEAKELLKKIPSVKGQDGLTMSMGLARVLGKSEQAAGQGEINIGHLLGAIVEDGDGDVVSLCKKFGLTKKVVEFFIFAICRRASRG